MIYLKPGEMWGEYVVVKDEPDTTSKCGPCDLISVCLSVKNKPECLSEKRKDKIDIHFKLKAK